MGRGIAASRWVRALGSRCGESAGYEGSIPWAGRVGALARRSPERRWGGRRSLGAVLQQRDDRGMRR